MPGLFHDGREREIKTWETIVLAGKNITYELERKKVKNINLRIRADGSVRVSAARHHSMRQIEALFAANEQMILHAIERAESQRQRASSIQQVGQAEEKKLCESVVSVLCRKYYPCFAVYCKGQMPEIRYRRMKSRWGSCVPTTGVLTFNTRLAYVPERCAEYVVVHEFCHFLYPNHSGQFYASVATLLPDWKNRRTELRQFEGLMV